MTAPPATPATTSAAPERILDIELTDEMESSFLEYAYSVIYSRALPDARDGLKPVQRRIVYQMAQMGLSPAKGHVKSARVVGEVMGKLHPHGDSAIYDALVRLAQPFSLRVPLVDGHGNFGSLDDGPAAARYTEARLRAEAIALVQDLDEDVVDFVPNYDNQLTQPSVLPAAFPNLLVNGASGIAVGMATNIPPHNLVEVIHAARLLISRPDASLAELMAIVPGPDLPTGGEIIGLEGIREAYETGRGSFKVRATVNTETVGPRRTGLVVTELPYLVGPERVIEKIKDAVNQKKLHGIADVTDLTDRHHGLRLVIGLKSGFDPGAVLSELYRLTPLEENFSVNSVALVDGQPQTLGLRDLLLVFIDHRIAVVTRRSRFRLEQRSARLHLVDGLLLAIADIDRVIAIIRASDDAAVARTQLRDTFALSPEQADYILELRLRRLTKFSRIELESERESLAREIEQLKQLLASDEAIRQQVSRELEETARAFGTPRRSAIAGALVPAARTPVASADLEIADAPCTVIVSPGGRLSRLPGGESFTGAASAVLPVRLRGAIGVVLSSGLVHVVQPMDVPEYDRTAGESEQGVEAKDFVGAGVNEGELVAVVDIEASPTLGLATRNGIVKRVTLLGLPERPVHTVITLKDGDAVVGAWASDEADHIVLVTDRASLLHFPSSAVRAQGLPAGGMAGISLPEGARVIYAGGHAVESAEVITVSGSEGVLPGTEAQRVKRTLLRDFPAKGRATGGVRAHAFLKGEDCLILAFVGRAPVAMDPSGAPVPLPESPAKRDSSGERSHGAIARFATRSD